MHLALVCAAVVAVEQWSEPPMTVAEDAWVTPPMVSAEPAAPDIATPPPMPPPVQVPADNVSAPPAVSTAPHVEPSNATPPLPAGRGTSAEATARVEPAPAPPDTPSWQLAALATATVPLSLSNASFLIGFRTELDVYRFGAMVSLDRSVVTPFAVDELQSWSGLAGYSVIHNHYARLRLLGGVSVLSSSAATQFAPTVGTTIRLGLPSIAIELSGIFTPLPFRQLDARAELVLRWSIFEVHGGYRTRLLDTTDGGSFATLFAQTPLAGPSIGLGFSL